MSIPKWVISIVVTRQKEGELIHISFNEIYFIHQLLVTHLSKISASNNSTANATTITPIPIVSTNGTPVSNPLFTLTNSAISNPPSNPPSNPSNSSNSSGTASSYIPATSSNGTGGVGGGVNGFNTSSGTRGAMGANRGVVGVGANRGPPPAVPPQNNKPTPSSPAHTSSYSASNPNSNPNSSTSPSRPTPNTKRPPPIPPSAATKNQSNSNANNPNNQNLNHMSINNNSNHNNSNNSNSNNNNNNGGLNNTNGSPVVQYMRKPEAVNKKEIDPLKEILEELGTPPAQVQRKDNANIDLLLRPREYPDMNLDENGTLRIRRKKNNSNYNNNNNEEGKEENDVDDDEEEETEEELMKLDVEVMYRKTKYLFCQILKYLSFDEEHMDLLKNKTIPQILDSTLTLLDTNSNRKGPNKYYSKETIRNKVKKMGVYLRILGKWNFFGENDKDYENLRKDAIKEFTNYEDHIAKNKNMNERLNTVLAAVNNHQKFLVEQYEAYKFYLDDVRSKCATGKEGVGGVEENKKVKDKGGKGEGKTIGPFKYSYNQLVKEGVIKESLVPKERRGQITFSFTSNSPGVYLVQVFWGPKKISGMQLLLDDLLEKQQENCQDIDTEFLKLDVNLLLHLLNRHFSNIKPK
eukprot:TRINITY_DN1936_c1_g1_i1.p2 TRINITY_DN1936_c1_g1~~TRINITY_DN1936_c1_g1_i1.p2  ORF type:complete len:635 (-),score=249.19 TRINITY_DN1936_c1_g1_i1:64-1968(-)